MKRRQFDKRKQPFGSPLWAQALQTRAAKLYENMLAAMGFDRKTLYVHPTESFFWQPCPQVKKVRYVFIPSPEGNGNGPCPMGTPQLTLTLVAPCLFPILETTLTDCVMLYCASMKIKRHPSRRSETLTYDWRELLQETSGIFPALAVTPMDPDLSLCFPVAPEEPSGFAYLYRRPSKQSYSYAITGHRVTQEVAATRRLEIVKELPFTGIDGCCRQFLAIRRQLFAVRGEQDLMRC